ncbi:MAG: FkbM family methyltransferase [Verrucomicrobiae bacterium]|nr:FkbM family methyltransferase [Verrucomicrobiae bacterium]
MYIESFINKILSYKKARPLIAKIWRYIMPSFLVKRRVFGLKMCFDSRDHPFFWYTTTEFFEQLENVPAIFNSFHGIFWDVGCNVGIYSLRAASLGHRVIAFDISPKAAALVEKSAQLNQLQDKITVVPRAFSLEPIPYVAPKTAIAGNQLNAQKEIANAMSISYLEAANQYGIPKLLKMDIEGFEEHFLKSSEFKKWIIDHKIIFILELHKKEFWDLLWKDVPMIQLSSHVVKFESK